MANSSAIALGITDPASFYLAVMNGIEPPESTPLAGFTAHTGFWYCRPDFVPILAAFGFTPNDVCTTPIAANGYFEIPTAPVSWPPPQGGAVSVLITDRGGHPVYRTLAEPLEFPVGNTNQPIWIYTPSGDEPGNDLPLFTIGDLASSLSGFNLHGLIPSVTSTTDGLTINNDPSNFPIDVEIEFGVIFTPNTSPVLSNLLGVTLNGYDIKVSGEVSWFTDTASVKSQLIQAIGGQTPAVNQAANETLTTAVTTELLKIGIAEDQINDFLGKTTVTIARTLYSDASFYLVPAEYNNNTEVVSVVPRIGFPRQLTIGFGGN